ncbi:MAG: DNA repair protein RadC [Pseudomonadota bacterium]
MGDAKTLAFDFEDGDMTPSPIFDVQTGHRARLRERFIKRGADALADYELLELYLFRTLKRQNTKEVARILIEKFGSFSAACSARFSALKSTGGVGDAIAFDLKLVEALAHRFATSELRQHIMMSRWEQLVRYCRTTMSHRETEHLRVLYLNSKNFLLADDLSQSGTINHVPVYPREIARRGLELGAGAVILIHNHPSGDPTPSDADITMTRQVEAALGLFSIALHDHVVVGRNDEVSFRAQGLLG